MKKLALIIALASICAAASAKVEFPAVIGDNMVLQQQTAASFWGKAAPGKNVTVKTTWSKEKYSVTADSKTGKWFVKLNTPAAGGPYEITVSDGEAVTLKNILIGEVWFCSGQSNMEMPMKGFGSQPVKGATDYIVSANASRPIRMCTVKRCSSTTLKEDTECQWKENVPDAVADCSATAYFFADQLQKSIGIPVGLLITEWGGSSIETWINEEVIASEFPEFDISYLHGAKVKTKANQSPCLLFNGQVNPLIPFTFKGMLWYQGEANRNRPDQYVRLQTAYVKMMRELFQAPDAPFYFVQIAPYKYGAPNAFMSGYFVEAQAKTLETIPNSGMAVTCDCGELGTIHPCEKQPVGRRLAYLALNRDYGFKSISADAPKYESVDFKDGKAMVKFTVDKMGLSPMGAPIKGFEIAGADRQFHPARAVLSKDHSVIEVSSPDVAEPAAVRYCFRNWCKGSLYNNFGIPAAPFRTDDWNIE